MQPGLFGHEPSFSVAVGLYLRSAEFMQPKKTHELSLVL